MLKRRLNCRAVITEIPIKLIIIVIIMAIGFAIIFSGFRAYDFSATDNNVRATLNQLADRIIRLFFSGGQNSADTITLTIPLGGTFARVEHIYIGDKDCGENLGLIRYRISEQQESQILLSGEGGAKVPVTTPAHDQLSVGSGQHTFYIQLKYDAAVTCKPEATGYIEIKMV